MEQYQPFDIASFDDHDLGHMEFIVNSTSWQKVFRPFFDKTNKMFTELLLIASPSERAQYGTDDYLRNGANITRKQLDMFDQILDETNIERMAASVQGRTQDYPEEMEF